MRTRPSDLSVMNNSLLATLKFSANTRPAQHPDMPLPTLTDPARAGQAKINWPYRSGADGTSATAECSTRRLEHPAHRASSE